MRKAKTRKIMIIEKELKIQRLIVALCLRESILKGKKKISIVVDIREAKKRIKIDPTCAELIVVSEKMPERDKEDLLDFIATEQGLTTPIVMINSAKELALS